jgi:thiol:disulfide interchange protein
MPSLDAPRGPALLLALGLALLVAPAGLGPSNVAHAQLDALDPGVDLLDAPDFLGGLDDDFAPPGKATFETKLESERPIPGGEVTLSVAVKLPRGHYIYATTSGHGTGTTIKIAGLSGLEPIDDAWQPDRPPTPGTQKINDELATVEKFVEHVTWTRRFRIAEDAKGTVSAELLLNGQYCSNRQCIPIFDKTLSASLAVESSTVVLKTFPPRHAEHPVVLGAPYPADTLVTLSSTDAKPGDEVALALRMNVKEPWHVYSTTMAPGPGGLPTKITIDEAFGLEPLDEFLPDREPIEETLDVEGLEAEQEFFEGTVTWTRRFRVVGDSGYGVRGSVKYMTCAEAFGCKPPATVTFAVGTLPVTGDEALTVTVAPEPVDEAAEPPIGHVDPTATLDESAETDAAAHPASSGLIIFLATAAGFGFFALLTPCVFPMVPITVSFFLKQSEKEHTNPLLLATVYSLGIIGTFSILGVLLAVAMGTLSGDVTGAFQNTDLANNSYINLFLVAVLVFFGLNMLGLFEIRMPSWLVNWSSGKQGAGGYVGALFMALTFTLMSFTCTFAFAGGMLVLASQGNYLWPILGMLAFSTAFALPFFVLALVPSWLQKLPKSGGWMNRVKVTMGLIEIGAAFKFLSVADQSLNGQAMVFDYGLVMCAWMVLAFVTGAYLLGLFRLPHDTPADSISVTQLGFAVLFLGVGSFLAVGMFSPQPPQSRAWDQIASFAPQRIEGGVGDIGPYLEHDGLEYALDLDKAIAYAKANDRPLFLDFTGVNCANCRYMEKKMEDAPNRKLLENFVRVQLYLDIVPTIDDPAERDRILARNRKLAVEWLKDVSMPSYAIAKPNGDRIRDVSPFIGVERAEGQFQAFLRKGVLAWQDLARKETATRVAVRP